MTAARGNAKLLKLETFAKLHEPAPGRQKGEPDYAMGWTLIARPLAGGAALTHGGTNTMWFASIWIAPKRDLAVVVATNQGGSVAAKACDDALWKLVQRTQ